MSKKVWGTVLGLPIFDIMQAHTACEVCCVELLSNTLYGTFAVL
jgi:hypothetical protein